ncbi:SMI1/KNR4 family protein [Vibrio neptunius]|uniref:SMI1/KNR4 family protein n=1 Tax=Vibrio neptunius TaxID=170651 RepID=UPI0019CF7D6A|nr:SMI1/KNR4 family protein [Vibrio neptunius]MBN3574305.1 SMI1/KNR4 family protein [Vibrio neptunius]QXX08948.1 SMI1/KNR4 family protein [Vibrio neptunius]
MSVKFSKPKTIELKDIDIFAQILGCSIPDDLKKFFVEFNGSKPETNTFTISQDNMSGVNELIPIAKALEERKYLDHVGERAFPVAVAEGGNYVVIDLDQGQSVYFWDHEEPQNMIKLANNIHEFLDALVPFDPNSVELKEGQVESAWIDPDFLKSLK